MKELPKYKAILTDGDTISGVDFISLVEKPAMEASWITLSAVKEDAPVRVDLALNEEKRIISGAVLIPNKDIYRRDKDGTEWYLTYDSDVIEQTAVKFFKKQSGINKTTLEHDTKTSGITVFESWIKASEDDKSKGLFKEDYPIGTWFVSMKVEKEAIWKDIKIGKFTGFSIEGLFDMQLIKDKRVKQTVKQNEENIITLSQILGEFSKLNTIYSQIK